MSSLYDKMMEKSVQESQHLPAPKGENKPVVQNPEVTPPFVTSEASQLEKPKPPTVQEKAHDTVIPRYHDTNHDTTIPSNHDTVIPGDENEMLEVIRKAVRQVGKEAATQRLTLEEK